MAQEMVQISQAQLMTMMGFQKQYIEEKEKKMSLEDDLKKSSLEIQDHKKKYADLKRKARVWLNNSEEAKKMEEEHIKSIKLIQDECKSKVAHLENQVDELKEKISLGSANAASLSELLAESDKNCEKLEADYKKALAEIDSHKKSNAELKKEISTLSESSRTTATPIADDSQVQNHDEPQSSEPKPEQPQESNNNSNSTNSKDREKIQKLERLLQEKSSALENSVADAKDKAVQVTALTKQNQKLTQLVDIYEIDSKKNKQSLEACTSLIKKLEGEVAHMKDLEAEVESLRTIKAQKDESDVKLETLEQEFAKEKEAMAKLSKQLDMEQHSVTTLTKLREQLETELAEKSEAIEALTTEKNEQAERIASLIEKEQRLSEVEEQVVQLNDSLKKCETAAREKSLEHKISEKQNQQMIKQLQNQLKIYTGSPIDSPLDLKKNASMISLSRAKFDYSDNESSEEFSNKDQSPRSGEFKRVGRAETISHLAPRHHSRTSSPMGNRNTSSSNDGPTTGEKNGQSADAKQWENDFGSLLSKFGKLQEENFMLNAQLKKKKADLKNYKEDSEKKSKVIQSQAKMLQVQGRSTMEMDMAKMQREKIEKQSGGLLGVFGSILGGTVQEEIETQKEVNEKMTSVLEQTLLKNVSLEDDLDTMGNEILKLNESNKKLEAEVARLQSLDRKSVV